MGPSTVGVPMFINALLEPTKFKTDPQCMPSIIEVFVNEVKSMKGNIFATYEKIKMPPYTIILLKHTLKKCVNLFEFSFEPMIVSK